MIPPRGLLLCALAALLPQPAWSQARFATGDPDLDALQRLLQPALESNRKRFRGRTGSVRGFGAGEAYPQIWLRDSATLIPLARYHYPRSDLASWLEEHLAHQRADGSLFDWIAAGEAARFRDNAPHAVEVYRRGAIVLSADRNTTETDQEASAVLAAGQVFSLSGDVAWLRKPVAGVRVIERLDAALESVRTLRTDRRLGLVVSALTADWGDVSPTHADQRAIYLDRATPTVGGLYTNALFVQAADALAGMQHAAGDPGRAERWRAESSRVRAAMRRHLWDEAAGFFRIHRVVEARGSAYDPAATPRFALGGHAVALLAGVAEPAQAARVLAVAEERRRRFGLPTIAGVLLPPFPRGFFQHPIQREEYQYQNGGQWDWWSGRYVLAGFLRGDAVRARAQLREIAARVAKSGGLYEWHTRDGRGMGSPRYAGSAGALGAAVFEGLFGIALAAERLELRVRLGDASGEVRVREPATGRVVSYAYTSDGANRTLRLRYQASLAGRGSVGVLLPDGSSVTRALCDGARRRVRIESVARDRYAVIETDWRPHELELRVE